MCICAKMHKFQVGSALSISLLFLALFNFLILNALELSLNQTKLSQLFYHKAEHINHAESLLMALSSGLQYAVPDLYYKINLDHQDACLNRYYRVEVTAKDALATAYARVLFIKTPEYSLPNCVPLKSTWVYEEFR